MSILALGFIVGIQHALEADHVAAVSSIVAEERSVRRIILHGLSWAVGHMLTISICILAAFWLGGSINSTFSWAMELAVGLMIVGLGIRLIYRQIQFDVRFSVHRHDNGVVHFHSHQEPAGDGTARHHHLGHGSLQSLFIGMAHGLAGSAVLLVLAATVSGSISESIGYVLTFAAGSIIGMVGLTSIIATPLRSLNKRAWSRRALRFGMGAVAIVVGSFVVIEQVRVLS